MHQTSELHRGIVPADGMSYVRGSTDMATSAATRSPTMKLEVAKTLNRQRGEFE
jgi:hypothetical protein